MIAIVTVLCAFPLGYLLRSRLAACTTYAIAYLWAFVFQTLYLLLDSLGDAGNPAFEAGEFPWQYGVMALLIFGAGFGLVTLGHRLGARRPRRIAAATRV
ncbi:MAG TPA: hypothetical protein VFO49_02765 [Nocardioides sp.]|nr:hypothetical protein [Nocardioides sp.]